MSKYWRILDVCELQVVATYHDHNKHHNVPYLVKKYSPDDMPITHVRLLPLNLC